MSDLSRITSAIIGCALRIHTKLGPGLLESIYEAVLARDLRRLGHHVERQKKISFEFEGMLFHEGLTADLIVDNQVIVELKSVAKIAPVHSKQLLSYLRLTGLKVGLLINFGEESLKNGIHRVVNGL